MDLLEHHVCLLELCLFVSSRALFVAEMWRSDRSGFHKHVSVLMTRTVCPQDHIALLQVMRINTILIICCQSKFAYSN